jgi:ankyrin repeat protein
MNETVVKLLLKTGVVDIDAKEAGRTLPPWAAQSGSEAAVRLLFETGKVDIDATDNSGRSPLS